MLSQEGDRHWRYFYNLAGHNVGEQNPLNQVVEYKRNNKGQLQEEVSYVAHQIPMSVWNKEDIKKCSNDVSNHYVLDAIGQRLAHYDAENYLTRSQWDAAGRATEIVRGDEKQNLEYDALDREVVKTSSTGLKIERQFHTTGGIERETQSDINNPDQIRQQLQVYDGFGQLRKEMSDPKSISQFDADSANRVLMRQTFNE